MTRPLKVGVQLPEVERVVPWAEYAEMARVAEAIGLDSLWVGDHLLYRYPDAPARAPWEAWSLLAALAAVTERVELGPLVASTSFHSPGMLVKKAMTVDEISSGRLILGLGAGWNEAEYAAYGFPFDHRVSRFEEAFTIIRRALSGERVDFDGRYHRADGLELLPRGPRPEGPPLMVGSIGERMLRITLPHVQAWNAWFTWFGNRPDGIATLRGTVDRACEEVGRDPATLLRTVALLVSFPGATNRQVGNVTEPRVESLPGDPERLADALVTFAGEGIGHVQLVLDPITVHTIAALEATLAILDA